MATIPSTQGNPQATDIAVETALPMVGSGTREDLQATLGFADAELSKLFEDRNVLITGGGTITYNSAGTQVTFSEALNLELNSRVAGGSPVVIQLIAAAGTKNVSASGRMIYAVINRTLGTATVTDDATTLPAVTSANQEVFLLAKRSDATSGARLYLRSGQMLEPGRSDKLQYELASGIDVDQALPMVGSAANDSLMSTLQKIDPELAKLFEDRNVLLIDGGILTWTGTQLSMTQTLKLHLNSRSTGSGANEPPAVIDLGSTTQTLNDGDMLYVVITRPTDPTTTGSATPAIATTATGLPRVTSANQEVFLLAKSSLSGDGVQRLYLRNGSALDPGQSARLGSSGSGSGSGNPILETMKNQLVDSPYQLLTPNVIATDTNTKIASTSGATYDLVNKVMKFTADGQSITSINLLDVNEFLSQGAGIGSVDLVAFWNKGTTLQAFAVPASFTYNVSRDGGNNYFPVTMSRVGTTEAFYGSLQFDTSTTTEATNATLNNITGGTQTNKDLNASTQQQLAQSFTVPANTNWVIKQVTLSFVKTGSPSGNVFVALRTSSGGLPTTTILSQSLAVTAASISTGSVTVNMPTTVLTGGGSGTTYELIVSTDGTYQSSYSVGVTSLALVQTTASTGEAAYNGTTWSSVAGEALVSALLGRTQDLRVQIVSAGSPTYPVGLDAFGIFYNLQNVGIVGATKKVAVRVFNSVTDNTNSFTITEFNPDPDLLTVYAYSGGASVGTYKQISGAFTLQGNVVTFPANTFNNGGVSSTMVLVFDQNTGGAFDNSDSNARLLATNHLGSTSGADDKSSAGRGIILRNGAGALVEVAVNASNQLTITSVP